MPPSPESPSASGPPPWSTPNISCVLSSPPVLCSCTNTLWDTEQLQLVSQHILPSWLGLSSAFLLGLSPLALSPLCTDSAHSLGATPIPGAPAAPLPTPILLPLCPTLAAPPSGAVAGFAQFPRLPSATFAAQSQPPTAVSPLLHPPDTTNPSLL